MRFRLTFGVALFSLASATAAHAVTVTVPDNYTTITGAIASGADVIVVRQGDYSGSLTISRPLELRAADPGFLGQPGAFPKIGGGITLNQPTTTSGGPIVVTGFQVTGAVSNLMGWTKSAIFHECRLDQGVSSNGTLVGALSLRGCIIRGNVSLNPEYIEMTCCTLIGGGLVANYEGDGQVRHNYIVGPAAVGMNLTTDDGGCPVYPNVVTGTTDGIVLTNAGSTAVTYNEVNDVSGDAFKMVRTSGIRSATFEHNLVRNSGANAFDLSGNVTVDYNTVLTAGGYGILAVGDAASTTSASISYNTISNPASGGILLSGTGAFVLDCNSNGVFSAGGSGISLAAATNVQYNTVGRSGGSGIVVSAANGTATYRNNTSYLNGHQGYALGGVASTSILNNIAYGNTGYGLQWTGTGTPSHGCNDHLLNALGAQLNLLPSITDRSVDPLFCDLQHNDVYVSASSPLVSGTCGQVGAKGIGCATPGDVPASAAGPLRFSVGARPTAGPVAFSWTELTEPGQLDVFDAHGARVWSQALPAGATHTRWGAGRDGEAPAPGVYFARLKSGARQEDQRVVVL